MNAQNQSLLSELQQAVNEALDKQGISQNELAKRVGVSASTLINVKRGEGESLSDKMVNKLRAYFRIDNWNVRNTHNFAMISQLCEDAQVNQRFLAVAGFTGAGKTTALQYYQKNNAEVYYVLANVLHTKRTFITAIQKAMGLNEGGSIHHQVSSIINKLNAGNRPLLIVDDAGKLSQTCMRMMQIIYDNTEHNAGIILSGTEYLKKNIDRAASKDIMGFRELRRRIAYWQPLERPSKGIVLRICSDYGIEDKGAVKYIMGKAVDYGTLRNLVLNAVKVSGNIGEQVSREILVDLHVGDYSYETQAV